MAPWQPPIPKGALHSKPARSLGHALPLLAYCYDLVDRDGWFDIVVKDAADDMQEPYQNVKRWWIQVRQGPFFCEQIDRGKRGWRMRFRDNWLDWRILNARPVDTFYSSTNEVSNSVLEENEVPMKYTSSTNEVSNSVLEENVYGTHDPDQADHDPPPPTQPPRVAGGGGSQSAWGPSDPLYLLFKSDRYDIKAARHLSVWAGQDVERVRAILEKWRALDYDPRNPSVIGARLYGRLEVGPAAVFAANAQPRAAPPQPTRPPTIPDALPPEQLGALMARLKAEQDKKKREAAHAA